MSTCPPRTMVEARSWLDGWMDGSQLQVNYVVIIIAHRTPQPSFQFSFADDISACLLGPLLHHSGSFMYKVKSWTRQGHVGEDNNSEFGLELGDFIADIIAGMDEKCLMGCESEEQRTGPRKELWHVIYFTYGVRWAVDQGSEECGLRWTFQIQTSVLYRELRVK